MSVTATFQHVWLRSADGLRLHARFWPASDPMAGLGNLAGPQAGLRPGLRHLAGPQAGLRPGLGYVVGHGFTGTARTGYVQRIARRLAERGTPVLSLDFRGHGLSAGVSTLGDREVHDMAAAVAWLRARGFDRVAVLGWSMGGSTVLRYAGLGGDADAVVSISSPGHWYERGTTPMRIVHWVCEHPVGRVLALLARGTRLTWRGWAEPPTSPIEVVGAIRQPLLLVHGDADRYFPARHAQLLAAAAPNAELWLEAGMGHAEIGTTPELVDRIDRWVRSAISVLQ